MPRPGDLIFCHGSNLISRGIRWACRAPGETPTYANHVAGFVDPAHVVEALWTVEHGAYGLARFPEPHQIWRHKGLTTNQREKVALAANEYVGRGYGWPKLLAHLGDAALAKMGLEVHLFRRLMGMDRYPICSWVWAYAYARGAGVTFGVDPSDATPDDMHDFVRTHAQWEMVHEYQGGGNA